MTWAPAVLASETADLSEDVRRLFRDIERQTGGRAAAGQCTPSLDVLETDELIELVVDLPGVAPDRLRILLKGGAVVIAGEKDSDPREASAGAYHLVERVYGRFARAVRIAAAVDGARAKATLVNGELRIALPKIHDRRGEPRIVPVG